MSIKGFEKYTEELNDYERDTLLPAMVLGMESKIGKDLAIKNGTAISRMKKGGFKITEARFRKIMHIIRVSGMIQGIVATSEGYYIASTSEEWEDYIQSITERVKHIEALRDALIEQHQNWRNAET